MYAILFSFIGRDGKISDNWRILNEYPSIQDAMESLEKEIRMDLESGDRCAYTIKELPF